MDDRPVAVLCRWVSTDGHGGSRLYLWCPGCSDLHVAEVGKPGAWTWDGNIESPTISPSLKVTGVQWEPDSPFHRPNHHVAPGQPVCCHSFVRAGRWEFLGDCTHHLVGQTVALPPLPDDYAFMNGE